jgi:hypothetical protein
MRTPFGRECRYFYGNYHRGRVQEECRLIGNAPPPLNWIPDLCKTCPVPEILLANSCGNMVLSASVKKRLFGLKQGVKVSAYCSLAQKTVDEPEIGCGRCHELPEVFLKTDP